MILIIDVLHKVDECYVKLQNKHVIGKCSPNIARYA